MNTRPFIYIICAAAVMVCCKKQTTIPSTPVNKPDIGITKDTINLTVTPSRIETGYAGGTITITLINDTEWEIRNLPEWIAATPDKGSEQAKISLVIHPNEENTSREQTIDIISKDEKTSIVAIQEAKPILYASINSISCDGDGGLFNFLYMNDRDIEITSDVPWINIIEDNSTIKQIVFQVLKNNEDFFRVGNIVLKLKNYPEIQFTVAISQGKRVQHPTLSFSEGKSMDIDNPSRFTLHPIFEDMNDHTLIWMSSDNEIAKTDDDGNIIIISSGKCTITATNTFHNVTASIFLNIMIKATFLKTWFGEREVTEGEIVIKYIGNKFDIKTILYPENAYDDHIVMISSAPEVAKISDGRIECIKEGITTISVESLYNNLRASYTLIVK